jgi:hypothetical protein
MYNPPPPTNSKPVLTFETACICLLIATAWQAWHTESSNSSSCTTLLWLIVMAGMITCINITNFTKHDNTGLSHVKHQHVVPQSSTVPQHTTCSPAGNHLGQHCTWQASNDPWSAGAVLTVQKKSAPARRPVATPLVDGNRQTARSSPRKSTA